MAVGTPPAVEDRALHPRLPAEVFKALFEPFDKALVKEKKQGGAKISFVEWYNYVARASQELAEFGFCSEVRGMYEFGGHLFIVVRVVNNETGCWHDQVGCAPVSKDKLKGYGGAGPEAMSQGLRRAFAMHGLGLDMYVNDQDFEAIMDGLGEVTTPGGDEADAAKDEEAAKPATQQATVPPTDDQLLRLRALGELLQNNGFNEDVQAWGRKLQKTRTRATAGVIIREMKALLDEEGIEYDEGK